MQRAKTSDRYTVKCSEMELLVHFKCVSKGLIISIQKLLLAPKASSRDSRKLERPFYPSGDKPWKTITKSGISKKYDS